MKAGQARTVRDGASTLKLAELLEVETEAAAEGQGSLKLVWHREVRAKGLHVLWEA